MLSIIDTIMEQTTEKDAGKNLQTDEKSEKKPTTTVDGEESFVLIRNKGGRPSRSILDKISVQRGMLQHIITTGEYETCYLDYCSRSTYKKWVRDNKEYWERLVLDALSQHKLLKNTLYSSNAKGLILQKIFRLIKDDKASMSEMMRLYDMLPGTPL